jgi:nickel-dependent lactate racemase
MTAKVSGTAMVGAGQKGPALGEATARELLASEVGRWNIEGKRLLLVVPDHTRTAPIDLMFRLLHELVGPAVKALDVLVALGTHPPLSDEAIQRRLGITGAERHGKYAATRFFNHHWADPSQVVSIGSISDEEVESITGGLMRERVDVTINKIVFEYDLLLIVGPTFPHEVCGFSGGNKYLFPGISGKEIIDMFHWLGALITNPSIIGSKYTPVREIIDRAASMVPVARKCASLVMQGSDLVGVYVGDPEGAWSAAADHSNQVNVIHAERAYQSVLSCAPAMYEELWVGGKCVYKLEPAVADGGEIIVYAPHIARVSTMHGQHIREIGYHVRDYFVKQMSRFAHVPRGVLAHSTHVKGVDTYEGGTERPRIQVTLATGIPEEECRAINLGYRDPRTIRVEDWQGREREGYLYVPKAGETLYRLQRDPFAHSPEWKRRTAVEDQVIAH